MPEIYWSLDIETDGPIPGKHSMIEIGLAGFTEKDGCVGQYLQKIAPWKGAVIDRDTYDWWMDTPEKKLRWEEIHSDEPGNTICTPHSVMKFLAEWIPHVSLDYAAEPVCLASPVAYDFTFFRWYYLMCQEEETPFRHRALDLRSFCMPLSGKPFLESGKECIPERLRSKRLHTHNALDDALEQGETFMMVLKESRRLRQAALYWNRHLIIEADSQATSPGRALENITFQIANGYDKDSPMVEYFIDAARRVGCSEEQIQQVIRNAAC